MRFQPSSLAVAALPRRAFCTSRPAFAAAAPSAAAELPPAPAVSPVAPPIDPASSFPPPPVPTAIPLPPAPEPEPVVPQPVANVRRPVGGFRGGLIGFLLGSSLVGGVGYWALLEDYKEASRTLLLSVEELKGSTASLTSHLTRISAVEDQLARLETRVGGLAPKGELDGLRKEYRSLIESEHLDFLALKAHLWGVEQDLQTLSKRNSNQVRI